MSPENITYKTKTVSEIDINLHLTNCNDSFFPPLNTRVNIQEYSKKIFYYAITFEAWKNQEIIGLIATYFDEENQFGFITNTTVTKEYLGLGIASKLLQMCFEYASNNHYKEIKLEVNKNNMPAINLYKKHNFTPIAIKDDFLLMKHFLNNHK